MNVKHYLQLLEMFLVLFQEEYAIVTKDKTEQLPMLPRTKAKIHIC